ncbi:thiamine pyrophosphate-binding protein [Saccharopolyspora shandongensis]|uniref:thiamine pyrophosphate-binding protein n=1 Tax=Saccharopolyspora shandongensis TaxID=418495 RepID=UPI0034047933
MTQQKSVARTYLDYVKASGTPVLFGLPGVHNLAFWSDLDQDTPTILGVRHEQTTVYAADGFARATGRAGFALTTTGPGAANAVAAFGEAAASGSPVVVIASEISTKLARPGTVRGVLHESRDQAGMFEPLAKAVYRPRTPAEASSALQQAVATAMDWPRGPVYLDVPTDVLWMPGIPCAPVEARRCPPADGAIRALADLVTASSNVVLWCGGGVVQSDAKEEVRELAKLLHAPIVTTFAARGLTAPGDPCHVGLPPHDPEVAKVIGQADLLLAIGTDFDGMMTRNWQMPMPARLGVINCDVEDLSKNYPPDVAVLGDARESVLALLALLPPRRARPAHDDVSGAWRRLEQEPDSRAALEFVRTVDAVVDDRTVVVCDMAVAGYWYGGYGTVARPRALQYPVGWGTLGYALPASIGPSATGQQTLVICGDGGIMFGLGELATIAQERLPVTVLVVDDGGYGMLAYDQEVAGHQQEGVDLCGPDWTLLGNAFGIPVAEFDETGPDLAKALRAALETGGPQLVVLRADLTPPRTTSPRWFS